MWIRTHLTLDYGFEPMGDFNAEQFGSGTGYEIHANGNAR